jgi:hypothetical protein
MENGRIKYDGPRDKVLKTLQRHGKPTAQAAKNRPAAEAAAAGAPKSGGLAHDAQGGE